MLSRRSLFRKLAAVVAAVAIAPEIAFGWKPVVLPHQQVVVGWDPGSREAAIFTWATEDHTQLTLVTSQKFREWAALNRNAIKNANAKLAAI